uniref:Uncharacterized protein n=1 Tax=Anopheles merus TaxID=30066 RepID=A0A1I8JV59_ANOME
MDRLPIVLAIATPPTACLPLGSSHHQTFLNLELVNNRDSSSKDSNFHYSIRNRVASRTLAMINRSSIIISKARIFRALFRSMGLGRKILDPRFTLEHGGIRGSHTSDTLIWAVTRSCFEKFRKQSFAGVKIGKAILTNKLSDTLVARLYGCVSE